jgi:alkylation response protein AidB-like acyl-CoA dehydrogenase
VRFHFNDEQVLFQTSVRNLLEKECAAEQLRSLWETETGRSVGRWSKLAEIGLLGLLVPEAHGGLALTEIDLVLPLEEAGRAALPEPLVETAAVGVPLLRDAESTAVGERWLPGVAAGKAILTVGHAANPLVSDAHVADLLLMQRGDEIHAMPRDGVELERQPCSDQSRRLFRVQWSPSPATRIAHGETGRRLLAAAFDRAALGTAAQLVGIGQHLVDAAVEYARQREQFGRPIGSFQAVKHMLANVQVRLEFARPVVYRAAFSVARGLPSRSVDVSHAKAAASDAALRAAKAALQVHGAIGYTWEVDLHIWMKRAWALEAAWGNGVWHRARIGRAVLDGNDPAPTFGYAGSRGRENPA